MECARAGGDFSGGVPREDATAVADSLFDVCVNAGLRKASSTPRPQRAPRPCQVGEGVRGEAGGCRSPRTNRESGAGHGHILETGETTSVVAWGVGGWGWGAPPARRVRQNRKHAVHFL